MQCILPSPHILQVHFHLCRHVLCLVLARRYTGPIEASVMEFPKKVVKPGPEPIDVAIGRVQFVPLGAWILFQPIAEFATHELSELEDLPCCCAVTRLRQR